MSYPESCLEQLSAADQKIIKKNCYPTEAGSISENLEYACLTLSGAHYIQTKCSLNSQLDANGKFIGLHANCPNDQPVFLVSKDVSAQGHESVAGQEGSLEKFLVEMSKTESNNIRDKVRAAACKYFSKLTGGTQMNERLSKLLPNVFWGSGVLPTDELECKEADSQAFYKIHEDNSLPQLTS